MRTGAVGACTYGVYNEAPSQFFPKGIFAFNAGSCKATNSGNSKYHDAYDNNIFALFKRIMAHNCPHKFNMFGQNIC